MSELGPVGRERGTLACMGLTMITLGIYTLYWYFVVHREVKRHAGVGLGGGGALVVRIISLGLVSPFLISREVGNLHHGAWGERPVSGFTGLWFFPGYYLLVGPFVWFVQTNGALNDYWRSAGALR